MIDPNILLQSQPVNIETQLQARTQAQGLNNLQNVGQLQQADLTGQQQGNQARQQELDSVAAINKSVAAHTSTDPQTGQIITDHNAVIGDLTKGGHEQAAAHYQSGVAGMQHAALEQQELQDKVHLEHAQHLGALANSVLGIADPNAQAVAYQHAIQFAVANKWAAPGELPATFDENAKGLLQSVSQSAMTVADQYKTKYGQERVDAYSATAEAAKQRAQALSERADSLQQKIDDAANGTWKPNGTRSGKAIYFNPVTGEEKVGGALDLAPDATGGNRVTATAALNDKRANQADFERNASAENKQRMEKDTLHAALDSGKIYVDEKGRVQTFSHMKTAGGNALDDGDIAALTSDMTNRMAVAQSGIEESVANKNNAMQRNGIQPGVSTAQAVASYRGNGPAPAASAPASQPAPAQATGQTFKTDPTGRSKFAVGQTVYDKQGNAVKIAGFTKDGKILKQ